MTRAEMAATPDELEFVALLLGLRVEREPFAPSLRYITHPRTGDMLWIDPDAENELPLWDPFSDPDTDSELAEAALAFGRAPVGRTPSAPESREGGHA